MITGDYRRTAERIAASIGLLRDDDEVLDREALAQLDDRRLQERVGKTVVFATIVAAVEDGRSSRTSARSWPTRSPTRLPRC